QIFPAEQIIERALAKAGIKAKPQHHLTKREGQYCLDFAIFCLRGKIAIECDNKKAHGSKAARAHDRIKDKVLKKNGWTVIRLPESEIIRDLAGCIARVKKMVKRLGDPARISVHQQRLPILARV